MAELRKIDSQKATLSIVGLIGELCAMVNVARNMSPDQIRMAAEIVAREFYWMKLDDIDCCFRWGIRGDFGQIYDRIDVSIILDWLKKYDQERVKAKRQMAVSDQDTNNIHELFNNPTMSKILQEVTDKLTIREEPKVSSIRFVMPAIEAQLHREFDKLYFDQGLVNTPSGIRTVKYQGLVMNQDMYKAARLSELSEA